MAGKHMTEEDINKKSDIVVSSVISVTGEEPEQIETNIGPAVKFSKSSKQSVTWLNKFPYGSDSCKLELVLSSDVANSGNFRVRVSWKKNGGTATDVDVSVTPGNNTNLYVADLGVIVPSASIGIGDLISFTLSRLSLDVNDTHAGNMLVYYTRIKREN